MILAGSDENTRPMRRVACRSVGRRILILAAMTPVTVQGCPATARDRLVSRGTTESSPWSGTRPFGVGEVAGSWAP